MRPAKSTGQEQCAQPRERVAALREHAQLTMLDLKLTDRAVRNAGGISLDFWRSWQGHKRTVEDLVALARSVAA